MNVISFVHEGLGNSSYLVGLGEDKAALVDPDRSAGRYLQAAEARGWSVVAVFETHLHADFVSGAREVAAATEAPVYVPQQAGVRFPHRPIRGGARMNLEGAEVEVIGSPGHTPEHTSYVFRMGAGVPSLFSGGSLIVGGAARTDLISPSKTAELTRSQYRTLRDAFTALPDETLLYPTHGGGSFCSTGAGGERTSTIGRERESNPVLRFEAEEEFARWFPTTFPAIPAYFARMRPINQCGPRLRREIGDPPPLSPREFQAAAEGGALVVDARPVREYAKAHIPGALSIAFRDSYATWLGWLAPADARLLLVVDGVPLERVIEESLLVGYESLAGWLQGGMREWEAAGLPVRAMAVIDAETARRQLLDGAAALDVREPDEYAAGHLEAAMHVPLGQLAERLEELPRDRPLVTYCGVGERSSTAASLLERAGFGTVVNLGGGFAAWRRARMKVDVALGGRRPAPPFSGRA